MDRWSTNPESRDERIAREANEHFGRSWITPWTVARVQVTNGGSFYSKIDRWIWERLVEDRLGV